jgi:stage V sporulation protein R
VSRVADEENWRDIKETLLQNVGTATIPVIKVEDSDYGNNRTLLLRHYHDGRDLQLDYAERTLKYVNQLWGSDVALDTVLDGRQTQLVFADGKFALKKAA